jgi:hypothetical protein
MPRPYHSPSSIALGAHCRRAWAYSYIAGIRDPEVAWTDDFLSYKWDHGTAKYWSPDESASLTAQARGSSLGKGMHTTAERWYGNQNPDWNWFPGLVLAAGKHLLPEPSKIESVVIEHAIGTVPLPPRATVREGQPTRAIEVHGVMWAGFRDLLAVGGDELRRLKINAPDGRAVFDYKSCSDFEKFALTHDELLADPQAALYAIDACKEYDTRSIPERWVYFANKKKRAALAIDVTAELSRALDVIGPCADLARELDTLTQIEDAPHNPKACYAYGNPERINCRYHLVNAGPWLDAAQTIPSCKAWGAFRSLVQIKKKEEITQMAQAITAEERAANFAKKKAEMAAKAAGAATAPSTEPVDAPESTPDAEDKSDAPTESPEVQEAPQEAAPAPVKPVQTTRIPASADKAKPAGGSQAATIAELSAELVANDKAREVILSKLRAAVA